MGDETLDPSQRAAEPLKPVPASELVRRLHEPGTEVVLDEDSAQAVLDNRRRAAEEIAIIFELNELASFQWFVREFIDPGYQKAFDELRNPANRQPGETLENVQARYVALREVKVGMLERELAHREQLDPTDAEIIRLHEKLNQL